MAGDRFEGDARGFLRRITVRAGADGRKADAAHVVLFGQLQAFAVTAGQLGRLVMASILIDGSHGVEDVLRGQRARRGDHGAASGTAARILADLIQLAHDDGPTGAVDRAIHSATAAQSGVGGVDHGIHPNPGDVADHQAELLAVGEIDLHAVMVTGEDGGAGSYSKGWNRSTLWSFLILMAR
jgi:hypothetical protein